MHGKFGKSNVIHQYFIQLNPVKYFDFVAEKFLHMLPHISMSLLKFYQAMKISLLSQGQ